MEGSDQHLLLFEIPLASLIHKLDKFPTRMKYYIRLLPNRILAYRHYMALLKRQ